MWQTTLCQATILHLSYSILHNPYSTFSHLTDLISTLHSYQRTNSFWCNRKTTILTELLPPSYLFDTHPASFLLVHQLVNCWKILQTPHLRNFLTLNHHSAYLSLLLPPIILLVRSPNSFKKRVDWLMSSTLLSKLGDIASQSAGSRTQVYSSKNGSSDFPPSPSIGVPSLTPSSTRRKNVDDFPHRFEIPGLC